jgi:type VI secretion system protein ImpM
MRMFSTGLPLPAFVRASLASDFLLWGKLPSQADYVRHNVRHDQALAVQEWICAQMARQAEGTAAPRADLHRMPPAVRHNVAGQARRHAQAAFWHSLTPPAFTPAPTAPADAGLDAAASVASWSDPGARAVLPWCFVLPPGTLPFARTAHVMGVWMASSDRIGRSYPLVLMQTVSTRWMRRYFQRHTTLPRDWLFYAARCLACAVYAAETAQDRPLPTPAAPLDHGAWLVTQLSQLWALYRPGWSAVFGRGMVPFDAQQLDALVGAPHAEDVAAGFDGVRYLPWPDWPQRLTGDTPQGIALAAFWQQDLRGRFVSAAETFPDCAAN